MLFPILSKPLELSIVNVWSTLPPRAIDSNLDCNGGSSSSSFIVICLTTGCETVPTFDIVLILAKYSPACLIV